MNEIDLWSDILEQSFRKTVVIDGCNKKLLDSDVYCGRAVLGKIVVLPMSSLEEFKCSKPWAAISITDPEFPQPNISDENRLDLIRLEFDDIEFPKQNRIQMNADQAVKIWKFVHENWNKIDLLMIHCHAGISRSTAVGKAISKKYQIEFADYFDQLYSPNSLVFEIMENNFIESGGT